MSGSAFPFDFGRISHRAKRPLKEMMTTANANRNSNGSDPSPVECNGNKLVSEMQLKFQSQQEELEKLKKELASQKVVGEDGAVVGMTGCSIHRPSEQPHSPDDGNV